MSRRTLTRISNEFQRKLVTEVEAFIRWVDLDRVTWEEAMTLAARTNISAPDCLHVAAAVSCKCHILVTSDQALQKLAGEILALADPQAVLSSVKNVLRL